MSSSAPLRCTDGSIMQKNKQDSVQLLSPDGPALRSEKQITTGKNTECVNPGGVTVPEFKNTAVLKCIIISLGSYLQALFGNVIPHGGKWQILTAALHLMWIFFVYFFLSLLFRCFYRLNFQNRSRYFESQEP